MINIILHLYDFYFEDILAIEYLGPLRFLYMYIYNDIISN
jgi:hypothetical protein